MGKKISLLTLLIFIFSFFACNEVVSKIKITVVNDGIENALEVEPNKKINEVEKIVLHETDHYKLFQVLVNGKESNLEYILNDNDKVELIYKNEYVVTIHIQDDVITKTVFEGERVTLPTPEINGYEFCGFYFLDELFDENTIINSDIELVAKFNKFYDIKIKYLDEEVMLTKKAGDVISYNELAVREVQGYEFIGFFINDQKIENDFIVNSNLEIEARYLEKYQVTINSNLGSLVLTCIKGTKLSSLIEEKEGYRIVYKSSDIPEEVNSDLVIELEYIEKVYYTVNFYDVFSELISSQKYEEGEEIILYDYDIEEGYIFIAWDTEVTFVTCDLDIYPIFDYVVYTIEYDNNNINNPTEYTIDSKTIKLNHEEKEGFRFLGWYRDQNYQERIEEITKGSVGDLYLYSLYEDIIYYDVYFYLNGGKINDFGFDQTYNKIGDIVITSFNGDFWNDYANNLFLYSQGNEPKALYSFRAGLIKAKDNDFVVYDTLLSGEESTSKDFSNCEYVLVVSSHNANVYDSVRKIINKGVHLTISNLSGLIENNIKTDAIVSDLGVIDNYKLLTDGFELPIPVYQGYEFLGWYTENGEKVEVLSRNMNKEIKLSANWKRMIGTPLEEVARIFDIYDKLFSSPLSKNIELICIDNETNATLEWEISDENVLSKDGIIHQTDALQVINVSLSITYLNEIYKKTYEVMINALYKDIYHGGVVGGYNYHNAIPDDDTLKAVDILYCAFGAASPKGIISNYSTIKGTISSYIDRAHKYGDYVILSISTSNLAEVAKDPETIKVFVEECVKAINDIGLDGIDIDWETPTVATKTNFTALMKELYAAVKANNPAHLVTAAIGGGPWQYVRYDLENSIQYIDFVNLMTYTMQTNAKSSHQSALYRSSKGYTLNKCSIDETIKLYNDANVPNNKILVGVPFYALSLKNTDGIGMPSEKDKSATQTYLYENYFGKNTPNVIICFDEECKVPYIYDGNKRLFYTFDNERSIGYKADYIKEKGLAGFMYWQNGQDYKHILLNAMYDKKEYMKW